MAWVCLSSSAPPNYSVCRKQYPIIKFNYNYYSSSLSCSTNFNQISFRKYALSSFNPLSYSVNSNPRSSTVVTMASSSSSSGSGSSDKTNEPLWKSFGKSIENFGKKSSVEDLLRQQIEKQEYYDEGGGGGGGNQGGKGKGGGGGGGFGDSEEESFSAILDETIQVILATLGFIFMYVYIINGAEMTRLAKDYISFLFGGRKSIRLTRALYEWERFCKNLTEKKEVDRFWLEKAIINTPTWWDSPDKYKVLLKALSPVPPKPEARDEMEDEYGSQGGEKMGDEYGSQGSEEMGDEYY